MCWNERSLSPHFTEAQVIILRLHVKRKIPLWEKFEFDSASTSSSYVCNLFQMWKADHQSCVIKDFRRRTLRASLSLWNRLKIAFGTPSKHLILLIICLGLLLRANLLCLCFHPPLPFYHFLSSLLPSRCSVVWADVCPGCWMKTSTSSPSLNSLVMCMLLQLTSSLFICACFCSLHWLHFHISLH